MIEIFEKILCLNNEKKMEKILLHLIIRLLETRLLYHYLILLEASHVFMLISIKSKSTSICICYWKYG